MYWMEMIFKDRADAARRLVSLLLPYPRQESVILTPLNGSVVIGKIISNMLGMLHDLMLISPLHDPFLWEEVIGAVSMDDCHVSGSFTGPSGYVADMAPYLRKRLRERAYIFKKDRMHLPLKGKTIIVVTEGIRTGFKLAPSLRILTQAFPARLVIASPVIAPAAIPVIRAVTRDIHSLLIPMPYNRTEAFYKDFGFLGDDELARIFGGAIY